MAKYIEVERYCREICRCAESENGCDKDKCPIWNAPAEDVLPVVHGEWEVTVCENLPGVVRTGSPHCNVCGKTSTRRTAFCPNCFAKMDGGIIKPMKRAGDSAKKVTESLKNVIDAFENADRCVCCGDIVPEGRQVCPGCETGGDFDG